MDKQAFFNLIDDNSTPRNRGASSQSQVNYHTQVVHNGHGNVVINNGGVQHNCINDNKNLTEDNKREVQALIDKLERENKFKDGQSANLTTPTLTVRHKGAL